MFVNILFTTSAILTILSAIYMAVTRNIIHSCAGLLGTLIGVAGLYVTLGADFVAAVQIMVYVGGVVILMLFAIMLTGGKDFMQKMRLGFNRAPFMGSAKTYGWAALAAVVFLLSVFRLLQRVMSHREAVDLSKFESTVDEIGFALLTDHVLAFELSSVLLLGALIGAAFLARPRR